MRNITYYVDDIEENDIIVLNRQIFFTTDIIHRQFNKIKM